MNKGIMTISATGDLAMVCDVNTALLAAFYKSLCEVNRADVVGLVEADTNCELQFYLHMNPTQAKNAFIYDHWGKLEAIQKLMGNRKGFVDGKYFQDINAEFVQRLADYVEEPQIDRPEPEIEL
jgi:hypothetical protein